MRSIISTLVMVLFCTTVAADTCKVPPGFTNRVYVVESDTLLVVFATDKQVYSPGDTLSFYLMVQNNGDGEFYENWGCHPQSEFRVVPGSCDSVTQVGCRAVYPPCPQYRGMDCGGTRLEPGSCRVWQESWVIASCSGPPPDGTYKGYGGMLKRLGTGTPPYGFVIPRGGAQVTIEISSSLPVEESSWGRIKALYRGEQ